MKACLFSALLVLLAGTDKADFRPAGRGTASLYRPWRKSRFVPYARYPGNWGVKPTPKDLVCAHRILPFWTILRLRTKRGGVAYCVVLDRGPYGYCEPIDERKRKRRKAARCRPGYKWRVVVRRRDRKPGGYYRGLIDATPAVHKMMGSRGWVNVSVEKKVGAERLKRVLRLQ